jgi:hypothetical protein
MKEQKNKEQMPNSLAKTTTMPSSNMEAMTKLLTDSGAKLVHKKGSILMPLSKKQRESMQK